MPVSTDLIGSGDLLKFNLKSLTHLHLFHCNSSMTKTIKSKKRKDRGVSTRREQSRNDLRQHKRAGAGNHTNVLFKAAATVSHEQQPYQC